MSGARAICDKVHSVSHARPTRGSAEKLIWWIITYNDASRFGGSCYLWRVLVSDISVSNSVSFSNLPVTTFTCAIPWESRRMTPIWDGVVPLRASLQICSVTCSDVTLSHVGGWRLYGIAEPDVPFPLEWRRPIVEFGVRSDRYRVCLFFG